MTITISPYYRSANISPAQPLNVTVQSYTQYNKKEADELYDQGYRDAEMWLSVMLTSGNLTSLVFRKRPIKVVI
jgi:hypothetical protein